ncbi:MAG: GFA family protein [Gammaproteobacteria bacterium]|nr:GFA family protein [Gammaproteobacteria bacterium]
MGIGNCLCRKIRYEFDDEPSDVSFCHCSICRRSSGSAFGAFFEARNESVRFVAGADNLARFNCTERLQKQFCPNCGTMISVTHADYDGVTYFALGTLAEDVNVTPEYHQYVGSKAPWHEIGDSLPKYENGSDD